MNQHCQNLHMELQNLKNKHAEYLRYYRECENNKEFSPLKSEKDQMKSSISHCRNKIEHAKELRLLKERYTENLEYLAQGYVQGYNNELIIANITWEQIEERLLSQPKLLDILFRMEAFGGEPSPIWYDQEKDEYIFVDCCDECSTLRGGVCYDSEAQEKAEQNGENPRGNAVSMAKEIGADLLTDRQFYKLYYDLLEVDADSYCWLITEPRLLKEGRANIGSSFSTEATPIVEGKSPTKHYKDYGFRTLPQPIY